MTADMTVSGHFVYLFFFLKLKPVNMKVKLSTRLAINTAIIYGFSA